MTHILSSECLIRKPFHPFSKIGFGASREFFFGGGVINFNCLIGQLKGFGGVRMECHILSLGKMINGRNSSDETATAPCGIIATHNFLQ